MPGGV